MRGVELRLQQALGRRLASPATAGHEGHDAARFSRIYASLEHALRHVARGLVDLGGAGLVGAVLRRQLADLVGIDQPSAFSARHRTVFSDRALEVGIDSLLQLGVDVLADLVAEHELRLVAVGRVLGQHQRTDLDDLVRGDHGLHGLAVVEVAVPLGVHADLHPVLGLQGLVSLELGLGRGSRLPSALHDGDRRLGLAARDVQRGLLDHTKRDVGGRCDGLVADRLAGAVARPLLMHRHHPCAVVGVGRDVQAQAHRVPRLERLRRHADAIDLIAGQRCPDVGIGSRLRHRGVGLNRLGLVDEAVVLCGRHLASLDLCGRSLQLRRSLDDVPEVHADA